MIQQSANVCSNPISPPNPETPPAIPLLAQPTPTPENTPTAPTPQKKSPLGWISLAVAIVGGILLLGIGGVPIFGWILSIVAIGLAVAAAKKAAPRWQWLSAMIMSSLGFVWLVLNILFFIVGLAVSTGGSFSFGPSNASREANIQAYIEEAGDAEIIPRGETGQVGLVDVRVIEATLYQPTAEELSELRADRVADQFIKVTLETSPNSSQAAGALLGAGIELDRTFNPERIVRFTYPGFGTDTPSIYANDWLYDGPSNENSRVFLDALLDSRQTLTYVAPIPEGIDLSRVSIEFNFSVIKESFLFFGSEGAEMKSFFYWFELGL